MLSEEKIHLITEALQARTNASLIAREFSCSIATVFHLANDLNIDLIDGKRKRGWFSDAQRAAIIAELQQNPCIAAVSRKLGFRKASIGRIAKQAGINMTKGRPSGAKDRRKRKLHYHAPSL